MLCSNLGSRAGVCAAISLSRPCAEPQSRRRSVARCRSWPWRQSRHASSSSGDAREARDRPHRNQRTVLSLDAEAQIVRGKPLVVSLQPTNGFLILCNKPTLVTFPAVVNIAIGIRVDSRINWHRLQECLEPPPTLACRSVFRLADMERPTLFQRT